MRRCRLCNSEWFGRDLLVIFFEVGGVKISVICGRSVRSPVHPFPLIWFYSFLPKISSPFIGRSEIMGIKPPSVLYYNEKSAPPFLNFSSSIGISGWNHLLNWARQTLNSEREKWMAETAVQTLRGLIWHERGLCWYSFSLSPSSRTRRHLHIRRIIAKVAVLQQGSKLAPIERWSRQ